MQSINPAFLYLIAFPVLLARATAKTADETTQLELATKAHAHDLLRLAHHQAARGERAGAPPLNAMIVSLPPFNFQGQFPRSPFGDRTMAER